MSLTSGTKGTVLVFVAVFIFVGIAVYYGLSKTVAPADAPLTTDQTVNETGAVTTTTTTVSTQQPMDTNINNSEVTELIIKTTKEGTGAVAVAGQRVAVYYTGRLLDGTVFDSNVDPKFNHPQAFTFSLGAGEVIRGWDLGVAGMKVGEKRTLTIPAALAYGAQSPSPLIPANSVLVFDVELLATK